MKRISIFLITVALIIGMVGYGGCNGSDPYADYIKIYDWTDLDDIRNNLEAKYVLMNNLDSSTAGYTELASPTANEGKGWEPIGTRYDWFEGIFDGQGYEICDLFINRPEEDLVGVFRLATRDSYIANIGVLNVNVTGDDWVGGLAGQSSGSVSECYSTGDVTGFGRVGGLVGDIGFDGTVSNSYSTGNVTSDFSTVGGLVGANYGAVSNSYSTSNVSGDMYVGGLVGLNHGTVSNSYSTGSVRSEKYISDLWVGGLVGYSGWGGSVSNSFWNTETSGQATSKGGAGKTTTEMQDITTFIGITWDLMGVDNPSTRNILYTWNMVDDQTYPFLSWEPVS